MADVAIDPGDFDQRRQDERRTRVERHAELLNALEKRRFVRVKFIRQRVSNLAQLGLLTQLRDQLGILLTEIGLLLATLTVTENVLCHNYLQSMLQWRHHVAAPRHHPPRRVVISGKFSRNAALFAVECMPLLYGDAPDFMRP